METLLNFFIFRCIFFHRIPYMISQVHMTIHKDTPLKILNKGIVSREVESINVKTPIVDRKSD